MSGYNMEQFLGDFAKRTVKNMNYIFNHTEEGNLFEVTQLINSLLGLIIIPAEAYKRKVKDVQLKHCAPTEYKNTYNLIKQCVEENRYYCDYPKNTNTIMRGNEHSVVDFITHIRNAVAHGGNKGIHFFPLEEHGRITSVYFYDNDEITKNESENVHQFCIKLSVAEVKILAQYISKMYFSFEKTDKKAKEKRKEHNQMIHDMNLLMCTPSNNSPEIIITTKEIIESHE
jgi:hypothetical protein